MRDLQKQMSDLQLEFDALLESHGKLRSRIGMRELRADRKEKPENPNEPDPAVIAAMSPGERKLFFRRKHFAGMDHMAFAKKVNEIQRASRPD